MANAVISFIKAPLIALYRWMIPTASDQVDPLEIVVSIPADQSAPAGGSLFSDVFKGKYKKNIVCVKRLRIFEDSVTRQQIQQRIINDAKKWKPLGHQNVLELAGVDTTTFKPMLALVLPWCENGNIIQFLQRNIEERDRLDHFIDGAAQGLGYLHHQSIVHGDIRGANVMIDDKGHVKLTDFGLVSYAEDAVSRMAVPTNRYGGGRWMAPELHYPEKFDLTSYDRTRSSDVFAFAMLVLEIYTEQPPFFDITHNATVYFKIVDGDRPPMPSAKQCPGKTAPCSMLWMLVERCWDQQPSARPTMDQVVERLKNQFIRVKTKGK